MSRYLAAGLVALLVGASPVWAVPAQWSDSITFTPAVYFGSNGVSQFGYTHDLANDPDYVGFPGHVVTSFSISVGLRDDANNWADLNILPEVALVSIPGVLADQIVEVDFEDVEMGVSLAGLVLLNATGQINITITRLVGDFLLTHSNLLATGEEIPQFLPTDDTAVPTPEPATALLMGPAFAALVLRRRRAA